MSDDYLHRARAVLGEYLQGDDTLPVPPVRTPDEVRTHLSRLRQIAKELRLIKKDLDTAERAIRTAATAQRAQGLTPQQRAALRQDEQAARAPYERVERWIEEVLVQLGRIEVDLKDRLVAPAPAPEGGPGPGRVLEPGPGPGPRPGPGPGYAAYTPPPAPPRPPPPTTPPTTPPRRRSRLRTVFTLFALVLTACCGLGLVGTFITGPALRSANATATVAVAATHAVQSTVAAQTAVVVQRAAKEVAATAVVVAAQSTATTVAALTPVAVHGFGDTATYEGWVLSLGRIEPRRAFALDTAGQVATPRGRYWALWLDARNTAETAQVLQDRLTFTLTDDQGQATAVLGGTEAARAATMAHILERDSPALATGPTALTHPLLVFDLGAAAIPQRLVVQRTSPPYTQIWFDLVAPAQAAAQQAATAEAVAAETATRVAIKASTAVAVQAAQTAVAVHKVETAQTSAANKAATVQTLAAHKTATAEARAACPPGARYGAICRDGSRSGATGSGACSHHGGVDHWLVCPP